MLHTRLVHRCVAAAGCALAAAVVLGTPAARGAGPATVIAATPVVLTDELIARTLAVIAEQKAAAEDLRDRTRRGLSDAHAHAVYTRRIDIALRAGGFASEAQLEVVRAVLVQTARRFDAATGDYQDPVPALEREIREIEASPAIPEASRARIVAALRTALEAQRASGVTPADVEAVRRNLARIREVLGH